jgi:hypothetical protein
MHISKRGVIAKGSKHSAHGPTKTAPVALLAVHLAPILVQDGPASDRTNRRCRFAALF